MTPGDVLNVVSFTVLLLLLMVALAGLVRWLDWWEGRAERDAR